MSKYHQECIELAQADRPAQVCRSCWDRATTNAGTLEGTAITAELTGNRTPCWHGKTAATCEYDTHNGEQTR